MAISSAEISEKKFTCPEYVFRMRCTLPDRKTEINEVNYVKIIHALLGHLCCSFVSPGKQTERGNWDVYYTIPLSFI